MAAKLAADNKTQELILQAPYYIMQELFFNPLPYFPRILLKYHFKTNEYLQYVNDSVTIFHG